MENYEHYTDEELIQQLRGGRQELEDYLMEKYKGMVRKKAHAMFLMGGEKEDLIQEGMIGLFRALRDFQPDKNASFSTFANLCVDRQLYKVIEGSSRQKHVPLNSYISLSEEALSLREELDTRQQNPESIVIDQENVRSMREEIRKLLSPFENQVLDMYLEGSTYTQIAERMEKSSKSIDNALQRMRSKIKSVVEDENGL